jgi:hypothetical protein
MNVVSKKYGFAISRKSLGKGDAQKHDFRTCGRMHLREALQQGATSQAAEKLFRRGTKCQGTTSVVPQLRQKNGRALAPEVLSNELQTEFIQPMPEKQ